MPAGMPTGAYITNPALPWDPTPGVSHVPTLPWNTGDQVILKGTTTPDVYAFRYMFQGSNTWTYVTSTPVPGPAGTTIFNFTITANLVTTAPILPVALKLVIEPLNMQRAPIGPQQIYQFEIAN